MAQEYIEGESLAQAMKAGPMDWPRAWQVAVDIGKALGYLHDQGVMHRNVMPPNIMIRNADHYAKLGDVILAKLLEENEAEQLTMPGELVGNVYYLAPERIGAKDDNRADLWSLGVTIYEMLAGHRPFQQPDLINKILTAKPESLRKLQPALPAAFEAIVYEVAGQAPGGSLSDRRPIAGGPGQGATSTLTRSASEGRQTSEVFKTSEVFHSA